MPTNKGKLVEYGSITKDDLSQVIVHDSFDTHQDQYRLLEIREGYECAGSVARWTDNVWQVQYIEKSGTTGGRRYLNREQAQKHWKQIKDRLMVANKEEGICHK